MVNTNGQADATVATVPGINAGAAGAKPAALKPSIASNASTATAVPPIEIQPTGDALATDLGCKEQLGSDSECPQPSTQDQLSSNALAARAPSFTFGSLPPVGSPARPSGFTAPASPASPAQLSGASPGRPSGLASPRSIRLRGSVRLVGDSIIPLPPAQDGSALHAVEGMNSMQGPHVQREPSLQHLLQHPQRTPPKTQQAQQGAAQGPVHQLQAALEAMAAMENGGSQRSGPNVVSSMQRLKRQQQPPGKRGGAVAPPHITASPFDTITTPDQPASHHQPQQQVEEQGKQEEGGVPGTVPLSCTVGRGGKGAAEGGPPPSGLLLKGAGGGPSPNGTPLPSNGENEGGGLQGAEGGGSVGAVGDGGATASPVASPSPRKRARKSQPARAAYDDMEFGATSSLTGMQSTAHVSSWL